MQLLVSAELLAEIKDFKMLRRAGVAASIWIVLAMKLDWLGQPNVLIAIAFALMLLLISIIFVWFTGGW